MPKSSPADKSKVETRQYKSTNKDIDTFKDAYQSGKVVEIGSQGLYSVKKGK